MAIDLTPNGVPGSSYDDFGLKSSGVTVTLTGLSANLNRGDLHVKRVIDPFSDLGPSGRPTGLYSFSNQITTELFGVVSKVNAEPSVLTVTGDANVTLAGVNAKVNAEPSVVTVSIPKTVSLTTLAGTTGLGSLTLQYAWTQTLDGTEGTGTLGDIVLGATLVGNEATTALGSLTLTTSTNETLTGLEGTVPDVAVTPLTDQFITIDGNAGTTTLGTITAVVPDVTRDAYTDLSPMGTPGFIYTFSPATPVEVGLTGVEATASTAIFNAWTVQHEIDGLSATASTNDVVTTQGATETLNAVAATTTLGTLSLPETVTLTGLEANAQLGGISAEGDDVSAELGGFRLDSGLGTISLSIDSVVSINGVEATGQVGLPVFERMIGVEGVTSLGTLATTQGVTVALEGVHTAAKTGFIEGTRTDSVFPLYFRCGFETEPRYNSVTMRNWTQLAALIDNEPLRSGVEIRSGIHQRTEIESIIERTVFIRDKAA